MASERRRAPYHAEMRKGGSAGSLSEICDSTPTYIGASPTLFPDAGGDGETAWLDISLQRPPWHS